MNILLRSLKYKNEILYLSTQIMTQTDQGDIKTFASLGGILKTQLLVITDVLIKTLKGKMPKVLLTFAPI